MRGGGGGEGGSGQVDLVVAPRANVANLDDATMRFQILAAPDGVFRFAEIDGQRLLADQLPGVRDRIGGVDLFDGFTLDATIEVNSGVFSGSLSWSSNNPLAGDDDSLAATLAYAARKYLSSKELSVEVATAIGSDVLAALDQIDADTTAPETDDEEGPVASLFTLYGQA